MESLGKHLSRDLTIELESEVAKVECDSSGYRLTSRTGNLLGEFDIVLWNCPPAQTETLLPLECSWRSALSKVVMVPCWAVMIAFENPWNVPFEGAFVNDGKLGWIANDASKPGRSKSMNSWVLHSTVAWAAENVELSKEAAIQILAEEAVKATGISMPVPCVEKAHRWLYSRPAESLTESALWDESNRLGACGDWCGGPRIEGAIKSGIALAGQVLGSIHERTLVRVASEVNSSPIVQLDLFS